jgi:crossover junction endodeoxyribonuclease RuvC
MILMGIDPGYAITGYGLVDYNRGKFRIVDYGVISTQANTPFEHGFWRFLTD